MGIYLNPGNDLFTSTVRHSKIYVDKTMMIEYILSLIHISEPTRPY